MGRVILIVCILSLAFVTSTTANDSTLQVQIIKTIDGDYKNFEVDNLGNIYLISNNNQLKKLNANFDSVANFNDTQHYGTITSVDVSNPLKILVFYKDFSVILILDRFLNTVNIIDLRKQGLTQINSAISSSDNKIWCYDELENKIKKIDDNGSVIFESIDFRILFDNTATIYKIIDTDGKLYCYNKQIGLLQFDYYGGLKHKYSTLNLDDIKIVDDMLIGFKNNILVTYGLKMLTENAVFIKQDNSLIIQRNINKNIIYLLCRNQLKVARVY